MKNPIVKSFFDEATFTASHIVSEHETGDAAVFDPVLDFDASSGRTRTIAADRLLSYIRECDLNVRYIIETHAHADHLSAAPYLREVTDAKIVIGQHIDEVQKVFGPIFNLEAAFIPDGSQFDKLIADGETLELGNMEITAMQTPGHTPACMSFLIGGVVFVGDTLFMPDYGTARCDFPGGDPGKLYDSIQNLFSLPDETRVFLCHDYKAPGRDEYAWETTIGDEKHNNIHLKNETSREDFIAMRTARDKTLNMPKLILPSVQVNIRAGELPQADTNGITYLQIPLNTV